MSPAVAVSTLPFAEIAVDLVILPIFEGEPLSEAALAADEATGGAIERALAARELQGRPYEFFITPMTRGWKAVRIATIGGGRRAACDTERLRRMAAAAALQARERRVATVAWLDTTDLEPAQRRPGGGRGPDARHVQW